MKYSYLYVALLLLCSACKEGANGVLPMSNEKAIAIIADVRLATEVVKHYGPKADSVLPIYMDSIFKIHKIDSTGYQQLIGYLEQSVGEYHVLEKLVHDELKVYQDAREVKKIDD